MSKQPFDVEITREVIKLKSVKFRAEGDIGYIRLTQFNGQAFAGLTEAIEKLEEEIGDKNVKGYILDLRSNPGGQLDQSIAVADTFLDQGEIVSTRGRNKEEVKRYYSRAGDLAKGLPVVVLINGGSASASEIVAGALHESSPCDPYRIEIIRQGLGSDHYSAEQQWCHSPDHSALLHPRLEPPFRQKALCRTSLSSRNCLMT